MKFWSLFTNFCTFFDGLRPHFEWPAPLFPKIISIYRVGNATSQKIFLQFAATLIERNILRPTNKYASVFVFLNLFSSFNFRFGEAKNWRKPKMPSLKTNGIWRRGVCWSAKRKTDSSTMCGRFLKNWSQYFRRPVDIGKCILKWRYYNIVTLLSTWFLCILLSRNEVLFSWY